MSLRQRSGRLRLPLRPREDPVLGHDELKVIATLLDSHIGWATRQMENGKVSESIIRVRMDAESARAKIEEALR